MEFIWASGLAFIASGAFSILGKPFEEHPFASFETSVNSQLSNYDTRLNNALLPNQNLNQVGPPLLADAVRTEAQRAAALSALPQTATLTAIGYVVGASLGSGYAVLLVLAAVFLGLGAQRWLDPHWTIGIGKVIRLSWSAIIVLALDVIGIVTVSIVWQWHWG